MHCASKYVAEHTDRGCITSNILVHPSHPSVRLHVDSKCDVDVTEDYFKVSSSSTNSLVLRTLLLLLLLLLFIFNTQPKLNSNSSALRIIRLFFYIHILCGFIIVFLPDISRSFTEFFNIY